MYTKTLPQALIIESLDEDLRNQETTKLVKLHLCISKIDGTACNKCRSCRLYEKENHPDLIKIEKTIDQKNISINIVRQRIIRKINSRPHLSNIICIVINNAQALSIGAQNSLLKTLEEPPSYIKIILAVNKSDNLLPTIRSRSQILSFCNKKNEVASENLLKKIINLNIVERFKIAKEIAEMDKKQGRKDAQNTLKFIDDLIINLRNFVKLHTNNSEILIVVLKDIKKILDGREKISYNANKQLVLENLLLQAITHETYKKYNN